MLFGTRLYGCEPALLVTKAQLAERLGFESLWRGDHLILPVAPGTPYPHAAGGARPFSSEAPVLEVLTVLAFLAQATRRIRLATGVLVAGLREPVALARTVQTLDVLSGGRVILGIGAGWLREEFTAIGVRPPQRGPRVDAAIDLMRALWSEEFIEVGGIVTRFEPKPVQLGGPPIVGGGESPAALARAAERCDGWYGHVMAPDAAAERVRKLRAMRSAAGVTGPFEITVRVAPEVSCDVVARLSEAGVDRVVAEIGAFSEAEGRGDLEAMRRFADRHLTGPARVA